MQVGGNSSLVWYKMIEKSHEKEMALFEKQPQIKREIQHFQEKAKAITTVDDLLKDRRVLQFALSAFQLEDQVNSKGLVKKLLTEDLENRKSLVNRLVDPRYKQFATAFKSLAAGEKPFQSAEFVKTIVGAYKTNEFEKFEGERNPALREALFFKRSIKNLTSVSQILANPTLSKVARVALGLPDQFAALEFDQQKTRLSKSIDLKKFKDPAHVEKFIQRFLVMSDMKSGGTSNPVLGLFNPGGGGGGGVNLLV